MRLSRNEGGIGASWFDIWRGGIKTRAMTLSRLPAVVLACVCAFPITQGHAAEAFFSEDGSTVTMTLSPRMPGLIKVNVKNGKITKAPLPAELKEEFIDSVARGGEGEALFLAKDAVWVWKQDATPPVKRVCATAPVVGATDLFVVTDESSPLKDSLFVSGTGKDDPDGGQTFFGRKAGTKTFMPVFCRRVSSALGGAFSSEGRFFFAANGDVWEGGILPEEDTAMERLGVLVGARIAPMAMLNTDEGNSGSMTVAQVAPLKDSIYVRLNGNHLAALMRIPMPAKSLYTPDSEDQPSLEDQIAVMKQSLAKAELIEDELEDIQAFCATETEDSHMLFYCGRDEKGVAMFLVDGDKKPKVIGYLPEQE